MDNKILFEVLKYVVIFFVSVFLPKKITYLIRSILFYYFRNLLKYGYVLIVEIILFFILYLNKDKLLFQEFNNLKVYFLILAISTIIINLFCLLRTIFSKSKVFFSIYPSFTIKENEFIVNDIQSEKINDIVETKINVLKSKFFVFRNNILEVELVNVPEFIPIILGIRGFLKYISKKLNRRNPISLYIQKDLLDSTLETQFFFDNNQFINTSGYIEIKKMTNKICRDKEKSIDEKIESILFLYLFINSQSFLDMTLDFKSYEETFHILNDLDEQLTFLHEDLKSYKIDEIELNYFINSWKGIIFRYFSIVYLEKNENVKAIDYIFKANEINPYYPQSEYNKAKQQYINTYMLELLPKINETTKLLDVKTDEKEISNLIINIQNKLEYESSTHNYQILIELINRNIENKLILTEIENNLEKTLENNDNVFSLIFIAEAYKYLPLGEEMENSIYVNRIPKIVEILQKAISLDIDFELLHLRIGSLLLIYGFHNSEKETEKAIQYMKKHVYVYSKFGLK